MHEKTIQGLPESILMSPTGVIFRCFEPVFDINVSKTELDVFRKLQLKNRDYEPCRNALETSGNHIFE